MTSSSVLEGVAAPDQFGPFRKALEWLVGRYLDWLLGDDVADVVVQEGCVGLEPISRRLPGWPGDEEDVVLQGSDVEVCDISGDNGGWRDGGCLYLEVMGGGDRMLKEWRIFEALRKSGIDQDLCELIIGFYNDGADIRLCAQIIALCKQGIDMALCKDLITLFRTGDKGVARIPDVTVTWQ